MRGRNRSGGAVTLAQGRAEAGVFTPMQGAPFERGAAIDASPAAAWLGEEVGGLFRAVRWVLGAFAVIFILWSALAPINGAVVAQARFAHLSERQVVQHADGGLIRRIHVTEGAAVAEGDLLFELDAADREAQAARLSTQLSEARAAQLRVLAELERGAAPDAAAGPALAAGARSGASHSGQSGAGHSGEGQGDGDASSRRAYEGQERLKAARARNRDVGLRILGEQKRRAQARLANSSAQMEVMDRRLSAKQAEQTRMAELLEKGLITRRHMNDLDDQVLDLESRRAALLHQQIETEAELNEVELKIAQMRTEFDETLEAELRQVEAKIADLEQQLVTARGAVGRTEVRAPRSGRVLDLKIHTLGAVVSPGETLMSIVPVGDQLYVAAQIRPQDVDLVSVGDAVRMEVIASAATAPPQLRGRVESVSADALKDPSTGAAYYLVRIAVDDFEGVDRRGLAAGAPVQAYFEEGGRSLISYLMRPVLAAFSTGLA